MLKEREIWEIVNWIWKELRQPEPFFEISWFETVERLHDQESLSKREIAMFFRWWSKQEDFDHRKAREMPDQLEAWRLAECGT